MSSSVDGDGGGRSTRKRGRRGKPRKQMSIDDVTCEDPFALYLPEHNDMSTTNSGAASASNNIGSSASAAGDGCYISALIHNRRYYGVLFDQDALKAATKQYFVNEASSLELNNRMKSLASRTEGNNNDDDNDTTEDQEPEAKRQKTDVNTVSNNEKNSSESVALEDDNRAVEKLRLVEPEASSADKNNGQPYRELVATYASISAASEDDKEKALLIQEACRSGGGWVGKYYFHYEDPHGVMNGVTTSKASHGTRSYRLSMGMDAFLRNASLPPWYPLANLECGQSQIMNMLNIKPDKKGGGIAASSAAVSVETLIPMDQRTCFRVGVIGGGIAGLACAHELLRLSKSEGLNLEIILLEARDRIGGRLLTDNDSFKRSDGSPVAVDMGASWIHGVTDNPLTALSREANVDLITSIEDVKMLGSGMKEIDRSIDDKMGDLFDSLLDEGASGCWKREESANPGKAAQKVCRWYGAALGKSAEVTPSEHLAPSRTSPPSHRTSTDITIDNAVGAALKGRDEFEHMSAQEHSLLRWYCENAQYALGADMKDLSMMFWDTDETHAFEGDHVYIKQGYSSLVEHLLRKCEAYGEFKLVRNFPVGKLEFARNSTSHPYRDIEASASGSSARIDLSDTCSATSKDGTSSYNFDLLVSAVPLGVLKDSVDSNTSKSSSATAAGSSSSDPSTQTRDRLTFEPPLPFSKRDSIKNVGFGLLNKVYLQFPTAFWRRPGDRASLEGTPYLGNGSEIFGNASGHNAQHYMFLDVGRSLNRDDTEPPAILMTLISGSEAVTAERLSDAALTAEIMSTLKNLYSEINVPSPTSVQITRWGGDEFSRGCYTFLPPGTSDQDYFLLQAPCNANGEGFMLDKSETMRLFFCGEHTTSLHPSMAHGAYLSGLRAAADVMKSTKPNTSKTNQTEDMSIPISIYRQKNPHVALTCNLCLQPGNRKREGALLAFQKGGRRAVAHSNCAAACPEVSLAKGVWKNVTRACARGSKLACLSCGQMGATIGCTFGTDACLLSYHFRCAENTGWNFDRDGKAFLCDQHRMYAPNWSKLRLISKEFYSLKNPNKPVVCSLCKTEDGGAVSRCGDLLAFRQGAKQILVHSNCLRHTTVVSTLVEDPTSEDDGDSGIIDEDDEGNLSDDDAEDEQYQNVFEAFSAAKQCAECGDFGATIQCSREDCSHSFHLMCSEDALDWTFDSRKRGFICNRHSDLSDNMDEPNSNGNSVSSRPIDNLKETSAESMEKEQPPVSMTNGNVGEDHANTNGSKPSAPTKLPAFLQHDLFCKGAATIGNGTASSHRSLRKRNYKPSNEYVFHAARDSGESGDKGGEAHGAPSSNTEDDQGNTNSRERAQSTLLYETVLTERLAVDPHLADPSRFNKWYQASTTAKRAGSTIPWNLQLSVVDHAVESIGGAVAKSSTSSASASAPTSARPLTLEVVGSRSNSKYCHGLEPGDVVVAINGTKIGSDDLPNFVSVANLMRTGLELRLDLLRRKCIEEIESPSDPNK